MIHFFDPSNEKMAAKVPDMVGTVDVLLGNLEDAVKADNKEAARARPGRRSRRTTDFGATQLWTRVNSPRLARGCLDDLTTLVTEIGDKLDVIMVPKVAGRRGHPLRRPAARPARGQGRARPSRSWCTRSSRPPAAWPTSRRSAAPARACRASRLGPADLAADRRMKTTRVGGGHPGYLVRQDPTADGDDRRRRAPTYQQDLWHYTIARMVDACATHGIFPYYGPFGDIADVVACEDQFRNAFLLGCVGAWSLHPVQIEIANRVFSPRAEDVAHARRVVAAMGDGTGAVMLDGKMEDDASLKQCLVMVELAEQLAERDPELKEPYDAIEARRMTDTTRRSGPAARCSTCRRPTSGRSRRPRRIAVRRADPRPRGRRRARRQGRRPATRACAAARPASTAAAR